MARHHTHSTLDSVLRFGTSLSMVALALASSAAFAQADPAADAEEADTADIVVTAQKREQKLRDVGIAVSVLGGEDVERFNITNATDVVRAIPNLKYNAYGSSQVVFNIRGVSQNDYGDQQEPPVAVYQDDSYASSITTASFPVFDLARVEALRGPQGHWRCSAVRFETADRHARRFPERDLWPLQSGDHGRCGFGPAG
jgi:iron complex outermembrane receptor protein